MVEKKPMDLKIVLRCLICEDTFIIDANTEDFNKWREGKTNIQDCFPYMSPSNKELLLSGICEDCWDEMFKENEEEQSRQRDKKGG